MGFPGGSDGKESVCNAGDEGPHLAMTGESWGCSRAAAPVCVYIYESESVT